MQRPETQSWIEQALERQSQGQAPWCWFDERMRGHGNPSSTRDGRPVAPPHAGEVLTEALANPALPNRHMLYIHIPFCSRICSFCAFNRRAGQEQLFEPFTKALINQIKRYAQTSWVQDAPIDSIFFGGGTPTALSEEQLVQILESIQQNYTLSNDCEITVESRIDDAMHYDIKALVDVGVNRMSFGIQSFDTDVRRAVGRIADQTSVLKTLDKVRDTGVVNLAVDLIYNLPDQTMDTWCKDLALLATTPANSVSIYALILQPGSTLARQIDEGKAPALSGLADEFAFFQQTDITFAQRKNWKQFSLSHFGDPAVERCGYNSARSSFADILGLGPGAAGCINNLAYMNTHDLQSFILDQSNEQDQHMMAMQFGQTAEAQSQWRLLTDGLFIDRSILVQSGKHVQQIITQLHTLGVIEMDQKQIRLTQTGRFWSGNLARIINDAVEMDHQENCDQKEDTQALHKA